MMPISDDNSDRHLRPYVNYLLILLNILVFVFFQGFGADLAFTYAWSTVPAEILTGRDIVTQPEILIDPNTGIRHQLPGLMETPVHVWFTLLSSMFMHGGFGHIAGNMLYLWIFGDNLENRMGHTRYLIFYLICGLIASLSHVFSAFFMAQNTLVPSLGASGAISGVMGGYMVLFPGRRVQVLMGYFVTAVPAVVALGIWILFQLISGYLVMGQEGGGVAYAAHIGGFIAGFILVKLFDQNLKGNPAATSPQGWR